MLEFIKEIFPTGHDWGTWAILFTAGYCLRKVYLVIEKDTTKLRKRIIHSHVKSGHKRPLKTCTEDNCALLSDAILADHF